MQNVQSTASNNNSLASNYVVIKNAWDWLVIKLNVTIEVVSDKKTFR